MKVPKHLTRIAAAAAMLMFSSASFASIVANGSFSFTNTGGVITYSPSSPGLMVNATDITIPTPTATGSCTLGQVCEEINSIAPTYLGVQNDFAAGGNTPLNINDSVTFLSYTFDLTFSTLPVFYFTDENGNRFTFTASSAQKGTASLFNTDYLNISYNGTFSDSLGLYSNAAASLSLTFTQTGGATGTVGYAGTFATPPAPTSTVPEPATMSVLGSALIGLGLVARKRISRR
jgi:PEP-CTERM motif